MHPNYRGLGLLLSLGSLPIACTKDDEDTDSSLPSTTETTAKTEATGGTTGPDGTATAGSSSTEAATDTGPAPTSTSVDPTADPTEDLPVHPDCQAYATHYAECFPPYANQADNIAARCTFYRNLGAKTDGAACLVAYDAYYVCLTMAPCAELKIEPPNQPCKAEQEAEIKACPGTV